MENRDLYQQLNEFQTPLVDLQLELEPEEIQEQFWDFFYNVPYIQRLTNKNRKRAKDLPKDEKGRIIVDITDPHILEDMDYFRPSAIYFQQNQCYTKLRPNNNPNSEYGKWCKEEARRCREGYVRPSDGEWITGDYYYFLNYAPMQLVKKDKKSGKKGKRVFDFARVWEGHYLKFHALNQARELGHHYAELASRGKGKSYSAAAMLSKRFILGESEEVNKKVTCYITADDKKYLVNGDQTLDKFQYDIDWVAANMEWPSKKLFNSLSNMQWEMGYKDVDTGINKGTLNSVVGVTSKDDPAKLRGSRGVLYVLEEFGTFPALLDLVGNLRPSVEDGEDVYGLIMMYGTAGDKDSDFSSAQELVNNPEGYNIMSYDNVWEKEGQGKRKFAFFFPGYLNYANCYDEENGVTDVTKALLAILKDRYKTKYNSTNPNAITRRIAEIPITPSEAMLKTGNNKFPVTQLTERVNQLDNNPAIYDDDYIGTLVQQPDGTVIFMPTSDDPIREFPLKDNKAKGALEIFMMPQKDPETGRIYSNRYIGGFDPVDDDESGTMSLVSMYILDLWEDKIVATWTGRLDFADDNFEMLRLLCLFYNARCLYENNKKGVFAYFKERRCLHLLAETPEYLFGKVIARGPGYGNTALGVSATTPVNNYANSLIRDWLLKPVTTYQGEGDDMTEVSIPNLYFIKDRALLKELIAFNPFINVDRIRALGMLMLYRQSFMATFEGDPRRASSNDVDPMNNDAYFNDYDGR